MKWNYQTTLQNVTGMKELQKFSVPRGLVLGRSDSINAAAFVSGHMQDFNIIAKDIDDNDWAWKNVKNYISDLRQKLDIVKYGRDQIGGEDYISAAENILNFTFNDFCFNGHQNGICPTLWTGIETEEGGVRSTSYGAYLRQLEVSKFVDVDVITFHRVGKLLFDEFSKEQQLKRITGVEAYNLRTMLTVNFTAKKEVVLCGGTYNTPKLLLLSGIGPKVELETMGIDVRIALGGVGKNLRDHYGVATNWGLGKLTTSAPFLFQSPTFNMFGPEKNGQTTYQFEISGIYGGVTPLRAESVGEVTLNSSDPNDSPLIDPRAVSTKNDLAAFVVGLRDYILPFFAQLIKKGLVKEIPG